MKRASKNNFIEAAALRLIGFMQRRKVAKDISSSNYRGIGIIQVVSLPHLTLYAVNQPGALSPIFVPIQKSVDDKSI